MNKRFLNVPFLRRTLVMLPSVPLLGLAISFFLKANMGADALSSLQAALSRITGVSIGVLSIIMNVVIVGFFYFFDRKLVGIGSVAFALGIGPSINLFSALLNDLLPIVTPLWLALVYIVVGTALMAVSIAHYLPLNLGAQATDMISLTIGRLCKKTVGFGMIILNAVVFLIAFLLGAPWGLGTLFCVFVVGKLVDWILPYTTPISKNVAGMPV